MEQDQPTNQIPHEQANQANNGSDGTQNSSQQQGTEGNSESGQKTSQEEFKVSGDKIVEKIKEIIAAGNARRIIIKNEENKVLMEIPVTWGVVGAVLLPLWAALGAMAALVANFTIVVEKRD